MKISLNNLRPEPIAEPFLLSSEIWANNITFPSGETVQVIAKSGQGKSTLLHVIYGLRTDYQGSCEIDNSNTKKLSENDWLHLRSTKLSLLFQDLRLFQNLTARENLELLPVIEPEAPSLNKMCEQLEVSHLLNRKIATLSLGQRQRFALIRSLRKPFKWLLLDEPFSHLDAEVSHAAAALIQETIRVRDAGLILSSLETDGPMPCKLKLKL